MEHKKDPHESAHGTGDDPETRYAKTIFKSQNHGKEPDPEELAVIKARLAEVMARGEPQAESPQDEIPEKKQSDEGDEDEDDAEYRATIRRISEKMREKKAGLNALIKECEVGPFWAAFIQIPLMTANTLIWAITLGKLSPWKEDLELFKKLFKADDEYYSVMCHMYVVTREHEKAQKKST